MEKKMGGRLRSVDGYIEGACGKIPLYTRA